MSPVVHNNSFFLDRESHNLPSADEFSYFDSFPEFSDKRSEIETRLLGLMSNIASFVDPKRATTPLGAERDDHARFSVRGV